MSGKGKNPVLVVGVSGTGRAGLPADVLAQIETADELWAGRRLLAEWDDHPAEKVSIGANIGTLLTWARARRERRIVVLASGDPLLYGIGTTLVDTLPSGEVEIISATSSLQRAFARVGIPWSDAVFTSAHARPLVELVGWAGKRSR